MVASCAACLSSSGYATAQDELEQTAPDANIAGSQAFRRAAEAPFRFFTFTLENDFFVNEDSGYTNGTGLTLGRGPFLEFSRENLPWHLNALTKNLYIQTMPNKVRGVSHMLFQRMQTPEDIEAVELQENDLPYAGLLALQSTLFAWDRNLSDQLSLSLGAVGPITFAEDTQRAIHSAIGSTEPLGWDNQLRNEFTFSIEARRVKKLYRRYGTNRGLDIVGLVEGRLGNIQSAAEVGIAMRWGNNLDFSHATFSLQADRQVNSLALSERNAYFFYFGATLQYVANDILINGNTFRDSHSVPLEHVQEGLSGGAVFRFGPLAYVFQLTSISSPTTISSRRAKFGSISVTHPFR